MVPDVHSVKGLMITLICTFVFAWVTVIRADESIRHLPIATASFPPFKFQNPESGEIVGFDTEVVRRVFQSMGIEAEVSIMPFQRADILTRRGKYAAYYSFTKNPDREQHYYFSAPISSVQDVIFKKKTLPLQWLHYADLANYRLGFSQRYNYDPDFLSVMEDKVPVVDDENEKQLLYLLTKERVDIAICEKSVCGFLINQNPVQFGGIDYYDKPIGQPSVRPFYVGFSKNWPNAEQLRDAFNVALAAWKRREGPAVKEIFEKYGVSCPSTVYQACK
ncbi:PAAT family ABC transporter substrate-binding protein [Oleiphilus messinensis]|uniref:PAAT family ABC transporter substrate-binding protein n=1 Tax=Oleiphilus messinensis TaxID=141451 RepID=A0A1Y0I4P4_9GAMM|nr:transporter substrate-binding domain-containing protein [Oleiphilus messinensis]ARU54505.1 PAAT family ABC transporter substrate-binding protein [Oleiphilus messinensis]